MGLPHRIRRSLHFRTSHHMRPHPSLRLAGYGGESLHFRTSSRTSSVQNPTRFSQLIRWVKLDPPQTVRKCLQSRAQAGTLKAQKPASATRGHLWGFVAFPHVKASMRFRHFRRRLLDFTFALTCNNIRTSAWVPNPSDLPFLIQCTCKHPTCGNALFPHVKPHVCAGSADPSSPLVWGCAPGPSGGTRCESRFRRSWRYASDGGSQARSEERRWRSESPILSDPVVMTQPMSCVASTGSSTMRLMVWPALVNNRPTAVGREWSTCMDGANEPQEPSA